MARTRGMKTALKGLLCGAAAAVALAAGAAAAATFENLYTVNVPIDASASDERAAAYRDAMAKLLTRVTGRRDAGSNPALEPLVSSAGRFVDAYAPRVGRGEARVGFFRGAIRAGSAGPAGAPSGR